VPLDRAFSPHFLKQIHHEIPLLFGVQRVGEFSQEKFVDVLSTRFPLLFGSTEELVGEPERVAV